MRDRYGVIQVRQKNTKPKRLCASENLNVLSYLCVCCGYCFQFLNIIFCSKKSIHSLYELNYLMNNQRSHTKYLYNFSIQMLFKQLDLATSLIKVKICTSKPLIMLLAILFAGWLTYNQTIKYYIKEFILLAHTSI